MFILRTQSSCLAGQVFNMLKSILRARLEIVCVPAHEHFASSVVPDDCSFTLVWSLSGTGHTYLASYSPV